MGETSQENCKARMQIFSPQRRIQVPLWSWIAQIWGLCVAMFLLGFSIWVLPQAKHPFGWLSFVVVLFRIAINGIRGFRETITASSVTICEDGVQRKKREGVVFYQWSDVTRYEPYRLDFAL